MLNIFKLQFAIRDLLVFTTACAILAAVYVQSEVLLPGAAGLLLIIAKRVGYFAVLHEQRVWQRVCFVGAELLFIAALFSEFGGALDGWEAACYAFTLGLEFSPAFLAREMSFKAFELQLVSYLLLRISLLNLLLLVVPLLFLFIPPDRWRAWIANTLICTAPVAWFFQMRVPEEELTPLTIFWCFAPMASILAFPLRGRVFWFAIGFWVSDLAFYITLRMLR